jgi:outer membrane protein
MLLVCSFSKITAQNEWSLNDCISYAITHNLDLKSLEYSNQSAKENYIQSFRDLLPSLSANSNYNILYGKSIDPNTNEIISSDFYSNSYYINAGIDVFRGFQKINVIKAKKNLYKATKNENLQKKYLLAFKVMTAFYDIKYYEGQLKIVLEQQEISTLNLKLIQKQFGLGMKAKADVYEAESVLSNDDLLYIQFKNKLETSKLKLVQLMNLTDTKNFKIIAANNFTSEVTNHQTTDSVYKSASSFIPIIKAQELRVNAAEKDISIAKSKLYPSLFLSAGYNTGFYETNINELGDVIPFSTQLKDNVSQYIGLSFRIPISDGWRKRSYIKQKKIALLQAKNNLTIQKQELFNIIQELNQNHLASITEFKQTKQHLKTQTLAFEIAKKKHNKGMISILEFYQAKNLFANAKSNHLQIELQLRIQKKTLEFYTGLPTFNIPNIN